MHAATDGHIMKRFDGELHKLQSRLLEMGSLVREQMYRTLMAVKNNDQVQLDAVLEGERPINLLEVKTDKAITRILARRSPVGGDLRFVVGASRMVTDLERMGDELIHMARALMDESRTNDLCDGVNTHEEVWALTSLAIELLDSSLEAFSEYDEVAARELVFGPASSDGELITRVKLLSDCVMSKGRDVASAVFLVMVLRSLERITRSIRHISEHTYYLVTGTDIRHAEDY